MWLVDFRGERRMEVVDWSNEKGMKKVLRYLKEWRREHPMEKEE